jgi:branched-chain amino acid aminotransferase
MPIRVNVDGLLGTEIDRLLSPLDQGFLFGLSVYETLRTYDGVPFLVDRHLKRLRESAEALDIHYDLTDEALSQRVEETLKAASNEESSIRIVVSAGVGAIDYRVGSAKAPTIVVIVRPLPSYPESLYREGTSAVFVDIMRAAPGHLDPRIKSSNLVNNLKALRKAHEKNAYEALMKNPEGEVCEGSMSNVFAVTSDVVRTPPLSAGILEGITRELLVEIAKEAGIELREETLRPADLLNADEVFITASARQVVPVVRIDDRAIGDGTPGPVTRRLIGLYRDKVQSLMRANKNRE